MRINVYAEEMTDEVETVIKKVSDKKFGDREFYGFRFYLKSPEELHADPVDDDRSAITLWVPWTRANGNDPTVVRSMLENMLEALDRSFPTILTDDPADADD